MRQFRKNVTDEAVKVHMKPRLEELMAGVVPRSVPEPVSTPNSPGQKHQRTPEPVTAEEREFLTDILKNPNLSITGRSTWLGLSANKMNDLKRSVIKKGLVEQFSVNLGKKFGGKVTLLALSTKGYKTLGKKPVKRPDNVSLEHWWWQRAIADYFNQHGAKAVIEKCKNGIRADVGLVMNGLEIAVEVELSPNAANIVADLAAGFDRVICCCKNSRVLRETRRRFELYQDLESIRDRVELKLLTELQLVKDIFGK